MPVERQRPLSLNGGKGNSQQDSRTDHYEGQSSCPGSWKHQEDDQAEEYGCQCNLNHTQGGSQIRTLNLTECNARIQLRSQARTTAMQPIGGFVDFVLDLVLTLGTILIGLQILHYVIALTIQIPSRCQEVLISRVLARPDVSQFCVRARDLPYVLVHRVHGQDTGLRRIRRVTRSADHPNIIGVLAIPRAAQDFSRGGDRLQCNIVDFSRDRRHVPVLESRNLLPVSIDIDHRFQILGDTLRPTCTCRCQLDLRIRRQQNTHQCAAILIALQIGVRSLQSLLRSCQGHPRSRRRCPVSVLAGLRARKIAAISLRPHEVLGGNNPSRSRRSGHLGPTSRSINRTRLDLRRSAIDH